MYYDFSIIITSNGTKRNVFGKFSCQLAPVPCANVVFPKYDVA